MYQNSIVFTHGHTIKYLLMVLGLFSAFILSSQTVLADSMPGGTVADPTVRAVDIVQPAVVRIVTTINGQLLVHFPPTTDVTFPQKNDGNYEVSFSGTGTFVSSQGDILTADHVVTPPKGQEIDSALYATAAQDIADYINQTKQQGSTQVTREQVLQQLSSGQLKSTPTYQTPSSSVFLSTAYTSQTNAPDFKSLPAGVGINVDKIKDESPPDKEDTAIIHVPLTDTLSVPLGNSANVHPQDRLTIIGFPGNADVSKAPDSLLTSSLNQIYVSSLKTSDGGAPLIQVGGNVEHGDSGGPALDDKGNIVGIVSFGVVNNSNEPNGTSFLQASSSAQAMLKSLNLDTTSGPQQKLWSQSFNDYAATNTGHWGKAQQGFANLLKTYPLFKATQPFRDYAQTQAKGEPTGTTSNQPTVQPSQPAKNSTATPITWQAVTLTVASIAMLVLLTAGLLGAAIRQRPKPKTPLFKNALTKNRFSRKSQPLADKSSAQPGKSLPPIATTPTIPTAKNMSQPSQPGQPVGQATLSLKVWPCGHMNRTTARFCSICGELAPTPPTGS